MKHLQSFSIFESSQSSYRYTFALPKTQQELGVINLSPEMDNYKKIGAILGASGISGFTFTANGGLSLSSPKRYTFKITPNRTIYYGSYQIGPSARYSFNSIYEMLDFLSIYIIGRKYNFNVSALDKFVFDGINPGNNVFNKITKDKLIFDKIIGIAKKYNPSNVIDAIVSKKESDIETYINDPNLVTSTDSYKFLDAIYGFHNVEVGGNGKCLSFRNKYFTPFGLFDNFIEQGAWRWGNLHKLCVGVSTDIQLKTYKALQNRVYKELSHKVNRFGNYIIEDTNPTISATIKFCNEEVLDQLESGGTDFNSSSLEPKMIEALERIKNESPISFSKAINIFKEKKVFQRVVDHFASDSDIVRGGALLTKFGFTDED